MDPVLLILIVIVLVFLVGGIGWGGGYRGTAGYGLGGFIVLLLIVWLVLTLVKAV
jgi:lipopolysaccharide export LptBFGC system permease protein LptF